VDNRPNEITPNEDKKITSKRSLDLLRLQSLRYSNTYQPNEDPALENIRFLVKDTSGYAEMPFFWGAVI